MKNLFSLVVLSLFVCVFGNVNAATISVYDGSLDSQLPDEQSAYVNRSNLTPVGTASYISSGYTQIDTMGSVDERLGFYVYKVDLDRTKGVNVNFNLRIQNQIISYSHRGAFDINISTNDDWGIHLYFSTNEIFSVDTDTLRVKTVSHTATSFIDYTVNIFNGSYTVYADSASIMSGSLLNYGVGYDYIGFGDRTYGAGGLVDFASMSLSGDGVTSTMPVPVPEPFSIILFLSCLAGAYVKKRII